MPRRFNLINPNETELLPYRSTSYSAGYDLMANEDVLVEPINKSLKKYFDVNAILDADVDGNFKPTMVHTGVTVTMNPGECLILANRSSNGTKRFITNPNGIGVVDADYEDEILVPYLNFGDEPYQIHKGDRIAQGIFMPFMVTDDDNPKKDHRNGGFGSTGN